MGIDLNTVDGEEEEEEAAEQQHWGQSRVGQRAEEKAGVFPPSSVCLELWHACAGPLISLPKKGSLVVYLPQGHLEQLGDSGGGGFFCFDVPPHVVCRVVDVNFHAEVGTDEVYAQLSLIPEGEDFQQRMREEDAEGDGEAEEVDALSMSSTPHMFCKTLTASDTSTHGGFSVPRRAAEDCFPPLDYKQQRPSQELIAKDLHGVEWKFRHIYRGQPRRHLLTTGWSAFVNKKKLVSGDAVLFLRADDGELRLGIRRAAQLKNNAPFSVPYQNFNLASLVAVTNAVSTRSVFHIHYNPRTSQSGFIIPYLKYTKSFTHSCSIGMRFRMRFESEDPAERRCTGLIIGIGDIDPIRWPGSKWRSLVVRWDDDSATCRKDRISPWEIEPTGIASATNDLSPPGPKRTRICFPPADLDFPVSNGNGCPELAESASFHKVLQGQEIMVLRTPYDGNVLKVPPVSGIRTHQVFETRRCIPEPNNPMLAGSGRRVSVLIGNSDLPCEDTQSRESVQFKVLQGQESVLLTPSLKQVPTDVQASEGVHTSGAIGGSIWLAPVKGFGALAQPMMSATLVSSPSSVLMFQQENSHTVTENHDKRAQGISKRYFHCLDVCSGHTDITHGQNCIPSENTCMLFGFPLTKGIPIADGIGGTPMISAASIPSGSQMQIKPAGSNCAIVHKQGSAVGRFIDLSKFGGYDDLICELERLFDMEGLLNDPKKGWRVVYTDDDDDIMLIGDGPWEEFCKIASRIMIYTLDEVEMMACRISGTVARGSKNASGPIDIASFSLGSSTPALS
ncbi:hypothetical protein J5N97_028232 [Dioscorea zingiberensis]|uniref:Auxin response factor n=1 Tax=Dioscorea zingiberensis TaxID=325984 RepID=A0A9D5BYK9_9LILI|nr:hypothetical protein J5N97_028232 [Dioscorea zingiberensis]